MKQVPSEPSPTSILEHLRVVYSFKWWISFSALVMILGSIVVIALLPDYYQATTTILVDPQRIPDRYVSTTVTTSPNEHLSTLSQEVLSATRLQTIIEEFHLYPGLGVSRSHEEIIEKMRRDIKVQVKEGSSAGISAFTITYTSCNRSLVAEVANRLASSFIEKNIQSRQQQATETSEFLDTHLQDAKNDLEQQESRLRAFRMSHLGEMPDQVQANMQALGGLHIALQSNADAQNRLDQERILLTRLPETEVKPGRAQEPLSERASLEAEKQQLEQRLADMHERYKPDYPDLRNAENRLRQVNDRLGRLPPPSLDNSPPPQTSAAAVRLQIIDREMERLKKEQSRIQSQIDAYQAKVDAVPVREQQMVDLNRNYEVSKQLYNSLLEKTHGAGMAADLEEKQKAEHFTILDPARTPAEPFKPKRLMLMGVSAGLSLLASIGLVILKETLNTTIKAERELKELLPASIAFFAAIPRIEAPADRRRSAWITASAILFSLLACLAVAEFLRKVHPIL